MKICEVYPNPINGKFEAMTFVNGEYDGHLNIKDFASIVVWAAVNGYKIMISK